MDLYVGRQPIFNTHMEVVGYELLYRSSAENRADFSDGDKASSHVILNTFVELGLDRLVGTKGLAFLNLTRKFYMDELPLPLKHDRIVLEVLEDIELDDEFLEALKEKSENGYKIALDDVTDPKTVERALGVVDIVKVDLMDTNWDKLEEHVAEYKKYNVQLLAEKVETAHEFEMCASFGFDLFQGYFLSKPNIVSGKRLEGNRATILGLLAKLQSPAIEFSELEEVISRDVSLSYKLLRLINSALLSRGTEIQSIRQALTLLGLNQIQQWVSLILLTESSDKPQELIKIAMIRAKMCEFLAIANGENSSEGHFIVGLFSILDALMDISLEEVLSSIPLAQEIREAILLREGKMGKMLSCVIAYEKGQFEYVNYEDLEIDQIRDSYIRAVEWVEEIDFFMAKQLGRKFHLKKKKVFKKDLIVEKRFRSEY